MPVTPPLDLPRMAAAFVAAAVDQGIPLNPDLNDQDSYEGVGLTQNNIADGRRVSVVEGYLTPAAERPNLTVNRGCFVATVIIEDGVAVGVRVRTAAADDIPVEHEIRAGRVILCAGALRSPHLLMLSGIGPADHLRERGIEVVADLPGVGMGLHDHPMITPTWPVTDGSHLLNAIDDADLREYELLQRGPLASSTQVVAMLRSSQDVPAVDWQMILVLVGLGPGMTQLAEDAVSCCVALLTPSSRGSVTLSAESPAGPPVVDPAYLIEARDRESLRGALKRVRELFAAAPLAAVTGDPIHPEPGLNDDELDDWIAENVVSEWHPVGTCRMGTDPMSVVDPQSMGVHGVPGLHVVDASVMPALTRGNTHAPTILIAEHAAVLIRRSESGPGR